jgi:curved DNA-binding protein CbpA
MAAPSDPYKVLGIGPEASEDQLRDAYRRLVRTYHPDHNQGAEESIDQHEPTGRDERLDGLDAIAGPGVTTLSLGRGNA